MTVEKTSLLIGAMVLPIFLAVKVLYQIGIPFVTEVTTQTKLDATDPFSEPPAT